MGVSDLLRIIKLIILNNISYLFQKIELKNTQKIKIVSMKLLVLHAQKQNGLGYTDLVKIIMLKYMRIFFH